MLSENRFTFLIPYSAWISNKYHIVFETIVHCPAVVYGQISVYHSSAVVYGICTLPYTTAGEWYMESKPILAEHGIKSVLHVKIRWSQGICKQMLLSTQSSNWTCTVNWSWASPWSINLTGSIRSCAGVTFTCVYPSGSVVFWLTEWNEVNQNTTDPEGYTQVNVTPAQEDLIEPVRLIDRGLARDQLTVQVQLELRVLSNICLRIPCDHLIFTCNTDFIPCSARIGYLRISLNDLCSCWYIKPHYRWRI